jgi:hypothetical protein
MLSFSPICTDAAVILDRRLQNRSRSLSGVFKPRVGIVPDESSVMSSLSKVLYCFAVDWCRSDILGESVLNYYVASRCPFVAHSKQSWGIIVAACRHYRLSGTFITRQPDQCQLSNG